VGQTFTRVFASQKTVAHPPPGGSIAANIAEATLVVAIWGAEADFFYCLIDNQTLCVLFHHP
jgi:hypothetical protein